jgi:arylsulfatase
MSAHASPPNLLIVLTDQQRFDAMSAHGGAARTPHLDSLAAQGVDLRQHYAQSPVCVPSRSTLFTGRYPQAHGVMENFARIGEAEVHLFKVLKAAGYWLAYHGKNHLLPAGEMTANLDRFSDPELDDQGDPLRTQYVAMERASLHRLATHGSFASASFHDFPDEATTTGVIAKQALESIAQAPADRPWCLVASFYDPHVPHLAPRRFAARHPTATMPVPAMPEGDIFSGKPDRLRIKYHAQGSDRATENDKRHYLSVYASMVDFVDEQLGHLLAALRTRPDADRTIVAFTSDHGDFAWHHGLCKKDLVLYEDLLHVPAVIAWPGRIEPRCVDHTYTQHTDILPTLLELAGLEKPAGCQGRSFATLLRGRTPSHRDSVYAEICFPWMRNPYPDYRTFRAAWDQGAVRPAGASYNVPGDHTKSVRTAEWSYLWYADGFEELYDLRADPDEWTNLAGDPAHATVLATMREQLCSAEKQGIEHRTRDAVTEEAARYPDWIPRRSTQAGA